MASFALLSRANQDPGPCKPHLLTLPVEVRRQILEFACADAYTWFEIKYNSRNPEYYVEGGGLEEFTILMSCSQLYFEGYEILGRSTWLDISCDSWSIDRLDFRATVTEILLRSPRTPEFLKKSCHFIEYVRISGGMSNVRFLKQTSLWLHEAFPCLKKLHIDKVEFSDRFNMPEEKQPRKIAEDSGRSRDWDGHLALTGYVSGLASYADGELFQALQALKSLKGRTITVTLKTDIYAICAEYDFWVFYPPEIMSVSYCNHCFERMNRLTDSTSPWKLLASCPGLHRQVLT